MSPNRRESRKVYDPDISFGVSASKLTVDGFMCAADSDAYTQDMVDAGYQRHVKAVHFMKNLLDEQLEEVDVNLRILAKHRKQRTADKLVEYEEGAEGSRHFSNEPSDMFDFLDK